MFTRRHYKEVARIIAKLPENTGSERQAKHIVIADLSDLFQRDNENFDFDKFLEACHALD